MVAVKTVVGPSDDAIELMAVNQKKRALSYGCYIK